jgi:hypothetical protein
MKVCIDVKKCCKLLEEKQWTQGSGLHISIVKEQYARSGKQALLMISNDKFGCPTCSKTTIQCPDYLIRIVCGSVTVYQVL